MSETSRDQGRPFKRGPLLAALVAIPVLLTAVLVAAGILSAGPPEGPPIAVFDIRSGVPFEHEVVSRGGSLQVWLDAACEECSYPIEGNLRLAADGRTLETVEISAGGTKRSGWEGGKKSMSMRGVLEADAPPAGVAVTLSGVLTVYGARDALMHRVREDAPAPRVQVLRLTVTE